MVEYERYGPMPVGDADTDRAAFTEEIPIEVSVSRQSMSATHMWIEGIYMRHTMGQSARILPGHSGRNSVLVFLPLSQCPAVQAGQRFSVKKKRMLGFRLRGESFDL